MEVSSCVDLTGWELRTDANYESLYMLLECVTEIAQAIRDLGSAQRTEAEEIHSVPRPKIVSITRRISVQIRKLLLDGNGFLLKQCVKDPNIHPLSLLFDYRPAEFVQHHEEDKRVQPLDDGTIMNDSRPAFDHIITVYPVYGVRHMSERIFSLYYPFDHDSKPMKFKKWMSSNVIEIDGHPFKAEQMLRIMSNKEGAHSEDNPAIMSPCGFRVEADDKHLHRLFNGIRFGSLTYLQIFSLLTGLYIANRAKATLSQSTFPREDISVSYMCETISQSPQMFAPGKWEISFNYYHLTVPVQGSEPRGDYSKGVRSYTKLPEVK